MYASMFSIIVAFVTCPGFFFKFMKFDNICCIFIILKTLSSRMISYPVIPINMYYIFI